MGRMSAFAGLIALASLVFALANRSSLSAQLPVDLLLGTVSLPLGTVLLAALLVVALVFMFLGDLERRRTRRRFEAARERFETLRAQVLARADAEKRTQEALEHLEETLGTRLRALEKRLTLAAGPDRARDAAAREQAVQELMVRTDRIETRLTALRTELIAELNTLLRTDP